MPFKFNNRTKLPKISAIYVKTGWTAKKANNPHKTNNRTMSIINNHHPQITTNKINHQHV